VIGLCEARNVEGAKLAHTVIKNALTSEARFRQVKTSGEKFKRSILGSDPSGLALLIGMGFEQQEGVLRLKREDVGLLVLGKCLLEDAGLVV
jgi:hypothetical protein